MHIFAKRSSWFKGIAALMAAVILLSVLPVIHAFAVPVSDEKELINALDNNDNIELQNDIVLSSTWTPKPYSGTLTGNGYIITTPSAFFAELSGHVTDLGVMKSGTSSDSALLAQTLNGGTVTGCFVYGEMISAAEVVGGLIGTMTSGTVTESFSCVEITANSASYVGGFIGKIEGGEVSSCYSAGSISASDSATFNTRRVAGFANRIDGDVSDTYTSCQLRQTNTRAKPSGVNGYYDNQLSIVRESADDKGLSTRELMALDSLPECFGVTNTSYPSLKRFYTEQWGDVADSVVRASTAAVAFSDVDANTRFEPSGFEARADYLTLNTYADRTNGFDLAWTLDAESAKVFDSIPTTSAVMPSTVQPTLSQGGTSSDLVRAEFEFLTPESDAVLTVKTGDVYRRWYLNACSENPYFTSGNGTASAPFTVETVQQLNDVRHYGLTGAHSYRLDIDLSVDSFDPIVGFTGDFNGNGKRISTVKLTDDGLTEIGVFSSTVNGAAIHDLTIHNVSITSVASDTVIGGLIGHAVGTTVTNVLVSGVNNQLTGVATVGGLIGKAESTNVASVLVSAKLTGGAKSGGIVGEMVGGTLTESGSTGYLIGTTDLGGLIGHSSAAASNCYSTMSVFSDTTEAANAGGLVGTNNGSVTLSYAASLVDAPSSTGAHNAVCGTGTGTTGQSYFLKNNTTAEGGLLPSEMVGTTVMSELSATVWTKSAGLMPQLTCFAGAERFKTLSALSTTPVYFQQYWNENEADDMTTGWISTETLSLETPTAIDGIHDGNVTAYPVVNGWGFEAETSTRRTALCFDATDGIGARVAAAVRPHMSTLKYTVTGQAGCNVYVELGFKSEAENNFRVYQSMHTIAADSTTENGAHVYDMPDEQYLRLKVQCADDKRVFSVLLSNGVKMVYDEATGYYTSETVMPKTDDGDYDTTVHIVLTANNDVPWGLRQQSY